MNINDLFSFKDHDPDKDREEIEDIKGSMVGESIDGAHLAIVAEFGDLAVQAAVAELCAMAEVLGRDSIPVPVLKAYAEEQSVAAQILWQVAEMTGADIDVKVSIPDDLSELDGDL